MRPSIKKFVIVAMTCILTATPVLAKNEAVACVQAQLTDLGQDVGGIDGAFGKKTSDAFEAYRATLDGSYGGLQNPALTKWNADFWCRRFADAAAEAEPYYATFRQSLSQPEGRFVYDVAPNVPDAQVNIISEGLDIAGSYVAKTFGGEISDAIREQMIVKIEATGKGNQERGGGNGAATAFTEATVDLPRPYFDVKHPDWGQNTSGRGWSTKSDIMKTVVHEYVHGWQLTLGAINQHSQPLGNWLNEGIGEYVAYNAMADAGLIKMRDADRFMVRAAQGAELENKLTAFGGTQTPAWAGHVGYLAISWLAEESPHGMQSVSIVAEQIGAGKNTNQAFAAAFNIELDDFYEQFEPWRLALLKNPDTALSKRPKLIHIGD